MEGAVACASQFGEESGESVWTERQIRFVYVPDVELKLKRGLNAMDGGGIGSSRERPSLSATFLGGGYPRSSEKMPNISGALLRLIFPRLPHEDPPKTIDIIIRLKLLSLDLPVMF
jgi:hypothetical protein